MVTSAVASFFHACILSAIPIVLDEIFSVYLEPTIGDKIITDVSCYRKQKLIARRN